MNIDLTGKTALVTGSTQGIGFAIAEGLANSGARVAVNGRTSERVEEAVKKLQQEGDVVGVAVDVTTEDGVARLLRELPDVDILVNNLGIFGAVPAREITDEQWHLFRRQCPCGGTAYPHVSAPDDRTWLGSRHSDRQRLRTGNP